MTDRTILVMGGAHVDRRGRISGETAPGASNPGSWFVEAGGGAFNAARNLARLGHRVRLVSPRGGDADGDIVATAAEAAGIEDTPFTFLDRATPSYTAIIERDGNLVIALADMDLYRLFSPRRLQQRAMREATSLFTRPSPSASIRSVLLSTIRSAQVSWSSNSSSIGLS